MDGVLIDSLSLDLVVVNEMLRERFQKEVSKEFIRSVFAYSIPEFWERILREAGIDSSPAQLEELKRTYQKLLEETPFPLMPGVKELLQFLKGKKPIGVASNNRDSSIDQILSNCGIRDCFDIVTGNDDIVSRKPAPDIYLLAAKRLGFPADQCLAIEDSDLGVRSAKAAGCFTVGVATGGLTQEDLKEHDPDMVVADLTEFPYQDLL
jgi:HAD superfamily hydrolase (TIGR01509 family)